MNKISTVCLALLWIACTSPGSVDAAASDNTGSLRTPAFPGAEGAGKYTTGGRGGDVYKVTTTKDSGQGSLRHAIESATGPRTIVFATSGTIELEQDLTMKGKKNITIAGQTAPGDGITLKNRTFFILNCEDIVVRFIRVRFGDQGPNPTAKDGMTVEDCKRIILDHISVSWTVDGMIDTRRCEDFTIQWSIFSEPLHRSIHKEGAHSKMMSIRDVGGATSLHHNLCVSSYQRFPSIGDRDESVTVAPPFDFRNNVLYNYVSGTNIGNSAVSIVNNYYRWGPDCKKKAMPFTLKFKGDSREVHAYIKGNYFDSDFPHAVYNRDNYEGVDYTHYDKRYSEESPEYVGGADRSTFELKTEPNPDWMKLSATQTPLNAYESVLALGGASLVRDAVDRRVVSEVESRTNKIIDSQDEVGGWPVLKSLPAPVDSDGDGMPDQWESANGLDPRNPADAKAYGAGKQYTNLELYLNFLVKNIIE